MSIFDHLEVNCPGCDTPVDFELVFSVSADRRPDLRQAILDGTFQRESCPSCGTAFRADPEFSYMDIRRGQYIGVWPPSRRGEWRECAARTQAVFDETLGAGATPEAKEIGAALEPRVVFGWAALVEKILCRDAGIDDRTLEVAKALVLRRSAEVKVPGTREFRLVRFEGADLVLAWVRTSDDGGSDAVRVPRRLIAEIEAAPERWQALRADAAEGLVVDFQRDLLAA